MIVYHGSDTIVDVPKILNSKRPLDFGGGFYVTTSRKQAEQWAEKVAYRNANENVCVNVYDFAIDRAERTLKILRFQKADEKWLEFVCANRQGRDTGEYDIVIGAVADDRVYRVVVEYENRNIDKETALKRMKTETLCDQILFHTEKSLEYLNYLRTEMSENG